MEGRDVVRHSVELVPEFCAARRLHGRVPRRAHRENGRARRTPQVRQAGKAGASYARRERRGRVVKVLLVDLEMEWRGGQNQALLLLKGLQARGHSAELVAPMGAALQQRACAAGIPVHAIERHFLRALAATQLRRLTRKQDWSIVHVNEPHALTAAWLARTHRRIPLLVSRRVGYPISRNRLARLGDDAAARST